MCEYGKQVVVDIPDNIEIPYNSPDRPLRKDVSIDKCLVDEIKFLWSKGIRTMGCCCGHGKTKGDIGVLPEDAQKMKDLGYTNLHNPNCPEADCYFIPKIKGFKHV